MEILASIPGILTCDNDSDSSMNEWWIKPKGTKNMAKVSISPGIAILTNA